MADVTILQQELDEARREVENLTVLSLSPNLSREDLALVKQLERSARAEVKLRVMALEYAKAQP
jgi:hypothetical protein